MKKDNKHLNKHRITTGKLASDSSYGMVGAFTIPFTTTRRFIVISSGSGATDWEHVSVRAQEKSGKKFKDKVPTWTEMCYIKGLFWDDECVIQYHPAKEDYVNIHDHVLHLWRPLKEKIPTPPRIMV
jgi:hypothetical protein